MPLLPELKYKFKVIPIKSPVVGFFGETDRVTLNVTYKGREPRIAKIIFEKSIWKTCTTFF